MKDKSHELKFQALNHECPFLIEKLLKECIVDTEKEGEALFEEVKKYMILVQIEPEKPWQMYSLRIDEVWHQFVLFTREYVDFCSKYFDAYIHHVPSNAPVYEPDDETGNDAVPGAQEKMQQGKSEPTIPTFEEFQVRYEEVFGSPPPDLWLDDISVTSHRRVVNYHAGKLDVREGAKGMVDLVFTSEGNVLMSVSELARDALKFIAKTGTFYVRELPGSLDDEEKVGLVGILVETKALRVAP